MLKKTKIALALSIGVLSSVAAYAASQWDGFPLVGDTAGTTCLSFGNNGVCNQFRPAGPAILNGTEQMPAANPNGPQAYQTVLIPSSSFGNGYGATVFNATTGTGQNPVVADGISHYVYTGAGTATFATITLPANPIAHQQFCIVNDGTGILTLTSINAGVNSAGVTPTFVGTTPTSIPVMTAVGTAGTVTLGTNCWLYSATQVKWYRVL